MPRPRIKAAAGPAARLLLLLIMVVAVARAFVLPSSASTSIDSRRYQQRPPAATSTTTPSPSATTTTASIGSGIWGDKTLLALTPTELAAALGGNGRARMVWKALAEGYDPHEADPSSPLHDARITPKTRALLQQRLARPGWTVVERVASRWVGLGFGCVGGLGVCLCAATRRPALVIYQPTNNSTNKHKHSCGTVKLVVKLGDGLMVETVAIPAATRTTVCVSSQVGCAQVHTGVGGDCIGWLI